MPRPRPEPLTEEQLGDLAVWMCDRHPGQRFPGRDAWRAEGLDAAWRQMAGQRDTWAKRAGRLPAQAGRLPGTPAANRRWDEASISRELRAALTRLGSWPGSRREWEERGMGPLVWAMSRHGGLTHWRRHAEANGWVGPRPSA